MPSSVIRAHSYDIDAHRLDVTFASGHRYSYFDVPERVAQGLARATSQGRYFLAAIRDHYRFARDRRRPS